MLTIHADGNDVTHLTSRRQFSTTEQGFERFRCSAELPAFMAAERLLFKRLDICEGANVVWRGRIEDVSRQQIGAVGGWRALSDVPYTSFWADDGLSRWSEVGTDVIASSTPERFDLRKQDDEGLLLQAKNRETYGDNYKAIFGYRVPPLSRQRIERFSFDLEIVAPTTDWTVLVQVRDREFGFLSQVGLYTAPHANATITLTGLNAAAIIVAFYRSGSSAEFTGETADAFARLSFLQLSATTSDFVLTSTVARDIIAHVSETNPSELSGTIAGVVDSTLQLSELVIAPRYPNELLREFAAQEGYATGVYDWLYFRPRDEVSQHWFVDAAADVAPQYSADAIRNSVAATFRDGEEVTTFATDALSLARYGIERREILATDTISAALATLYRDARLGDSADALPRETITIDHPAPWRIRAGDRVTLRNVEDSALSTFVVGRTDYDMDKGEMRVSPREPLPILALLLARAGR